MKKEYFENRSAEEVNYLSFEVESPKCSVVISHGMAETPIRYEALAKYLNERGISVYAIYHVGHGEFAKQLGHMDIGGFDSCISNLSQLVDLVKEKNKTKVFLIGHSMGSFISQLYITKYDNIDGLILSGSTKSNFSFKFASALTSFLKLFNKDLTKPANKINKIAFGNFNKKYNDVKTEFDWLTKDEEIVNKYIEDPYCGWVGSLGFFYNLFHGAASMGQAKRLKNINLDLPIYIEGGKDDPVSNYSKGLVKLLKQYQKIGVKDVSLTLYDTDRHEIFNELDKDVIYSNTYEFINKHN